MIELVAAKEDCVSVRYNGRWLYHPQRPLEHARRKAERVSFYPNTLYIIVSPVLWYGADHIRNNLPAGSSVIALELENDLRELALKNIPDGLDIPLYAEDVLRHIDYSSYRRVIPVYLSSAHSLNRERYDKLLSHILSEIERFWRNKLTLIRLGHRYVRNIFSNIGLSEPVYTLPYTKNPVIVAAAGPSLEKSMLFIKKYRTKVFLTAVDTAAPVLIKHDIVPDLIIILESQIVNSFDFVGVPRDIPVLFDMSANPSTTKLFSGRKHAVVSNFAPTSLITRLKESFSLPVLPALASVGSFATYLASLMTDNIIILAGLDFYFYRGLSHARGSLFHYYILEKSSRLNPWPFLWERKLISTGMTDLYTSTHLSSFSSQIEEINTISGGRIFSVIESPLMPSVRGVDDGLFPYLPDTSIGYKVLQNWSISRRIDFLKQEKVFINIFLSALKEDKNIDADCFPEIDYIKYILPGQSVDLNNRGTRGIAISAAMEFLRRIDASVTYLKRLSDT
ncbi:6-hydroxymethylpterin diphosphokinase MptE-like protein [Spirochaetia bacterium 38H-sp]|uniref:6-hydroxymethylpterin diphosphokinase MptE-like protein n=1 Tax=Rarispira pelagica TaxID=3141764 RepID=A0ABU9UBY6_9SPIR